MPECKRPLVSINDYCRALIISPATIRQSVKEISGDNELTINFYCQRCIIGKCSRPHTACRIKTIYKIISIRFWVPANLANKVSYI